MYYLFLRFFLFKNYFPCASHSFPTHLVLWHFNKELETFCCCFSWGLLFYRSVWVPQKKNEHTFDDSERGRQNWIGRLFNMYLKLGSNILFPLIFLSCSLFFFFFFSFHPKNIHIISFNQVWWSEFNTFGLTVSFLFFFLTIFVCFKWDTVTKWFFGIFSFKWALPNER